MDYEEYRNMIYGRGECQRQHPQEAMMQQQMAGWSAASNPYSSMALSGMASRRIIPSSYGGSGLAAMITSPGPPKNIKKQIDEPIEIQTQSEITINLVEL